MEHYYWNDWYSAWGWFLWFGMILLIFSSFGNWGYTYRVHRLYGEDSSKTALDFLNDRYARGEIQSDEYQRIKSEIKSEIRSESRNESGKQSFSGKKSPA